MYRCMVCEAPAQIGCGCSAEKSQGPMQQANYDPWGWPDQPRKLDIQAGVFKVFSDEEMNAYP